MAVLRKEKKNNFTIIDNAIFKDHTLSMKAKGLLCQMLSLPDGWEWSVEGLTRLSTDGISAVRSALDELETAGYFRRQQIRKDNKIAGVEYIISETKMCENLISENLILENLTSENLPQLNTNELNTDSLRTKELQAEFDKLWDLYPKKQGKRQAFGHYERARKSGTTYEEVEQGINAYIHYLKVTQTGQQFIKMGSTFFSQRAWQDDWSTLQIPSGNPFMDMLRNGEF